MSDQNINLRVRNTEAKKAVDEVNRALGQTEQAEKRILEVTSKSQSMQERLLRTLERRAALAGKSGGERLAAERDLLLGRVGGDVNAINRVTAAYQKLIAEANRAPVQKVESFFGAFLKAGLALSAIERIGGAMKGLLATSANLAAETEMYGVAMRAAGDAAGYHADYVGNQVKAVAALGIVLKDARASVSRMTMSGMDIANAPALARMAQNLAVLNPTETSSSMFGRLVYGIQSGQTEVLRTGGVNVSFEAAYASYAKSLQRTAASLTEEEKLRIRLDTVMKERSKSEGLYEQSLGTTGKQMQSLKRYATDAQVAIGEQLLPALGALVSFATWGAKVIAENPAVARGLAVGGSSLAGAAVGAGIGFVIGNAPGAMIGAKIGAGIGAAGGGISMLYGATRPKPMTQLERSHSSMRKMLDGTDATAYEYLLGYTRAPRAAGEAAPTDDAQAKKMQSAMSAARRDVEQARMSELDGLAKIDAEYESILTKLREEGTLTTKIADLYRQVSVYKANAYLNEGFAREAERLTEIEERGLSLAKERLEIEAAAAAVRAGRNVDTALTFGRGVASLQQGRLEANVSDVRERRDMELMRAGDTEAEKLAITLDYIDREKQAQLDLLDFKAELARREIAIKYAGNESAIRMMTELADAEAAFARERLTATAKAQRETAEVAAMKSTQRTMREEYARTFDSVKRSAEGLFDALIVGGRNFGDMLRRTLLLALLTPVKQTFSSFTAMMLTGQRAAMGSAGGVAPIGGGGGLGAFGALAPIVGGPGGTGGFSGTYGGGGGGMGGYAGMFGNPLGGLTALGNIGMARGPVFARDGVTSQAMSTSGVGGWQGGALLAGGVALGADGLRRGGWLGMAETTAGGAMIGYKFGGAYGAAIGAAVGAGVGLVRMMFKGRDQKIIDEVRKMYSVTIDKQFAKVLSDQSRGQDMRVFLSSPGTREQIEIYAAYTGQRMGAQNNVPRGVNLAQSGGGISQTGSFVGGIGYSYSGSIGGLPGLTPFAAAAGGGAMILDANETRQFWANVVEQGVVQNPRAVQTASNAATASSFGRIRASANLTDPLAATI